MKRTISVLDHFIGKNFERVEGRERPSVTDDDHSIAEAIIQAQLHEDSTDHSDYSGERLLCGWWFSEFLHYEFQNKLVCSGAATQSPVLACRLQIILVQKIPLRLNGMSDQVDIYRAKKKPQ
ncbi:hypothetical protein KIN20_003062 [Parelaphostrongylus tenuis]|uniref:Uncharacterized protein n=1 Tax=Parelaphostrongylus tenuis TaxID=148309 RepID=A0AAD5QDD1_PARTN|nr:hypothetical protein KIN20_003062 [Parelaphostrongylus tenuis]